MHKKLKKGFTLTELIVVIVIIGILAAVLIPTISGYVQKARIANEQTNVKNLNLLLTSEAIFDDVTYYDTNKVIEIANNNGYDLKSSIDGYSYWYDRSTNKIVFVQDTTTFGSRLSADSLEEERNTIEALSSTYPSYLYIDQRDNTISEVIKTIKNLPNQAFEQGAKNSDVNEKMQAIYDDLLTDLNLPSSVISFVEEFNPSQALYVDGVAVYTNNQSSSFKQIIFTEGITSISSSTGSIENISCEKTINVPSTVILVEAGGLLAKVVNTQKVIAQSVTLFEEGSYVGNVTVTKASTIILDGSSFTIDFKQKEIKLNDGTIQRLNADDNEVGEIVRKYLIPSMSLNNNTFVNFGDVDSCIAKSKLANDYIKIEIAVIAGNKNYKIENIGYITDIDTSVSEIGRIKVSNENELANPVAEYLVNINIDINELAFTSKLYEGANIQITYKGYNQEYNVGQVSQYGRIVYEFQYGTKTLIKDSSTIAISMNEFKTMSNIYDYFHQNNLDCNTFEIEKVEIILNDTIIFSQIY